MQISDQSPYDTPLIASYLRVFSTLGLKNARIKSSGAGWSSLAARRAHNPKVIGSNPIPATKHLKGFKAIMSLKPFFIFCSCRGGVRNFSQFCITMPVGLKSIALYPLYKNVGSRRTVLIPIPTSYEKSNLELRIAKIFSIKLSPVSLNNYFS